MLAKDIPQVRGKVPLTTQYFKFSKTDEDSPTNDTIDGFSDAVVADPRSMLEPYNSLDFSNLTDTNYKYIGGDCQFDQQIAGSMGEYIFDK
jgi:hypothetical protein